MTVRSRNHATQRDPFTVNEEGTFGALFAAVYRGRARHFTFARGLHDAPIDREIFKFKADHLVVRLQTNLLKLREDPGRDPFVQTPADRGG